MKKLLLIGLLILMAGCANTPMATNWRASGNKKAMVNLRPDMSVAEVLKVMGSPDKTEMYRGKDREVVLVYLYITEGMDMYGRWNQSNYTPLVFINERLDGWGWSNLEETAQRYEVVFKAR